MRFFDAPGSNAKRQGFGEPPLSLISFTGSYTPVTDPIPIRAGAGVVRDAQILLQVISTVIKLVLLL